VSDRLIRFVLTLALALCTSACAASLARATLPMRDGTLPSEVVHAFDAGVLSAPARPTLGTTAVQGHPTWVVPVILVDFTDQPLSTLSTPAAWERTLFDTTHAVPTGSAFDYYLWVSRGQLRLLGKVVAVIHLSQNRNYYAWNAYGLGSMSTPHNDYGVVNEAISLCDAAVDFSPYDQDHDGYVDMLWVVHSGIGGEATVDKDNLYSVTSQMDQWNNGTAFVTNDPVPSGGGLKMRINRFTILPELSQFHPGRLSEIGVFCHEFGHALGLPDLYDTTGGRNLGPGNFSLMSTGAYGTDGATPESPSHMGAWPLQFLGWIRTISPAFDTTLTPQAIEDGGPAVSLWFQGKDNPEHFLMEYRRRSGFDLHLPAEGMVLYHVDEMRMGSGLPSNRVNGGDPPALRLIEADGFHDLVAGTGRGDAADVFPGSTGRSRIDDETIPGLRSNSGAATGVAIENIRVSSGQLGFLARVRSRGWKTPTALPGTTATPGTTSGPGPRAVLLGDDSIVLASSETPGAGRPQIRLRTQRADGTWGASETVSNSTGSAVDPTVAPTPGGGLALVWSDSRTGANQLWYRTRLNGVWSPETRITSLPGSSRNPSVGVDARGSVHVAWLYTESSVSQVRYQRFYFLAPGDTSTAITGATDRPDAPGVCVAPSGSAIVLWPERSTSPIKLWFCHVAPDSGVGPRNRLTVDPGAFELGFSARMDDQGTLHTVWTVPNASTNDIHYQRREATSKAPSIRDTVIERRSESIANLSLSIDPNRCLHLAYEIANGGIPQLLYKHAPLAGNWDMSSTEVTLPADGIASRPAVVAREPSRVSMLYLTYPAGVPTWVERRREARLFDAPTAVLDAPSPPRHWLALSPDPSRSGTPVRIVWAGPPLAEGARVTLFDLSGRRVAAARMIHAGASWTAVLPATLTREWSAGVYFARIDGQRDSARLVLLR